jgi:hypothetical protein
VWCAAFGEIEVFRGIVAAKKKIIDVPRIASAPKRTVASANVER